MGTGKLPCWEGITNSISAGVPYPTTNITLVDSGPYAKEIEMDTKAKSLGFNFTFTHVPFYLFNTSILLLLR